MVNKNKNLGGVRNSAIASQHCPSGHITADKKASLRPNCLRHFV